MFRSETWSSYTCLISAAAWCSKSLTGVIARVRLGIEVLDKMDGLRILFVTGPPILLSDGTVLHSLCIKAGPEMREERSPPSRSSGSLIRGDGVSPSDVREG